MSGLAELRDSLREANDKIAELEKAYDTALDERDEQQERADRERKAHDEGFQACSVLVDSLRAEREKLRAALLDVIHEGEGCFSDAYLEELRKLAGKP